MRYLKTSLLVPVISATLLGFHPDFLHADDDTTSSSATNQVRLAIANPVAPPASTLPCKATMQTITGVAGTDTASNLGCTIDQTHGSIEDQFNGSLGYANPGQIANFGDPGVQAKLGGVVKVGNFVEVDGGVVQTTENRDQKYAFQPGVKLKANKKLTLFWNGESDFNAATPNALTINNTYGATYQITSQLNAEISDKFQGPEQTQTFSVGISPISDLTLNLKLDRRIYDGEENLGQRDLDEAVTATYKVPLETGLPANYAH